MVVNKMHRLAVRSLAVCSSRPSPPCFLFRSFLRWLGEPRLHLLLNLTLSTNSEVPMTHESQSPPHAENSRPGRSRILWFLVAPVALCLFGAIAFFSRAESQKKLVATTQAMEVESVSVIHAQPSPPAADLALPATLQAFSD